MFDIFCKELMITKHAAVNLVKAMK